jgi:TatD DNase family protein
MACIDFHCHLDLYDDPQAVASEAVARGSYVLSVTTTPSAFEGTAALAPANCRIRTALGLHPELAIQRASELPLFDKLLPKTAYVGEVGLDGSREHRKTLDHQAGILMDILLMCARAGGKIISLHSREARPRLLELLSIEPLAGTPVLHWFSGSAREIEEATDLGCWFSVGPAMLASERGRLAVSNMPRNRIVPETDGPFGERQGRPLMPWEAMEIEETLVHLWKESNSNVRRILTANFRQLTGFADRHQSEPRSVEER